MMHHILYKWLSVEIGIELVQCFDAISERGRDEVAFEANVIPQNCDFFGWWWLTLWWRLTEKVL